MIGHPSVRDATMLHGRNRFAHLYISKPILFLVLLSPTLPSSSHFATSSGRKHAAETTEGRERIIFWQDVVLAVRALYKALQEKSRSSHGFIRGWPAWHPQQLPVPYNACQPLVFATTLAPANTLDKAMILAGAPSREPNSARIRFGSRRDSAHLQAYATTIRLQSARNIASLYLSLSLSRNRSSSVARQWL